MSKIHFPWNTQGHFQYKVRCCTHHTHFSSKGSLNHRKQLGMIMVTGLVILWGLVHCNWEIQVPYFIWQLLSVIATTPPYVWAVGRVGYINAVAKRCWYPYLSGKMIASPQLWAFLSHPYTSGHWLCIVVTSRVPAVCHKTHNRGPFKKPSLMGRRSFSAGL